MVILKTEIREATPNDVPGMMALERAATTAAHWREEEYRRIFEPKSVTRLVLVSEGPDGLAGFVVAIVADDEWEIENVVVADHHQRRGIGSRLVSELTRAARARGATAVFLEVRESNAAARSLYERCAFERVGRRRCYYRDPEEDALIYRLALADVR